VIPSWRWPALASVVLCVLLVLGAADEARQAGGDVRALVERIPAAAAWRTLGMGDYEEFMAFCSRRIPGRGAVLSIVLQPAIGYYRAAYDLYPRTVWPYVSPQDPHADEPHPLPAATLARVLAATKARYLAVWHVALPRPLPPVRWVATFAPGEYVIALR
jgi:hypothetical protein